MRQGGPSRQEVVDHIENMIKYFEPETRGAEARFRLPFGWHESDVDDLIGRVFFTPRGAPFKLERAYVPGEERFIASPEPYLLLTSVGAIEAMEEICLRASGE